MKKQTQEKKSSGLSHFCCVPRKSPPGDLKVTLSLSFSLLLLFPLRCSLLFAPSLFVFCSPCTAPSVAGYLKKKKKKKKKMCPFCSVRFDSLFKESRGRLGLAHSLTSLSQEESISTKHKNLVRFFYFFVSHNSPEETNSRKKNQALDADDDASFLSSFSPSLSTATKFSAGTALKLSRISFVLLPLPLLLLSALA